MTPAKALKIMRTIVVSKPATATEPTILFSIVGPDIPEALIAFLKALYPEHVFTRDEHGALIPVEDVYDILSKRLPPNDALRKERIKAGLTQEQLTEMIGLCRPHYSRIEEGKCPISRKLAQKVADALGVPYTKFFY